MRTALLSEALKLVTTRVHLALLVGASVVAALGTFSTLSSGSADDVRAPLADQQFFLVAITNLAVFAVVLGATSFTDEFRHGTVVVTALLGRDRLRTVAAKTAVAAVAGAVLAGAAQAVMVALAVVLGWSGGDLADGGDDWRALAGLTAATAAWAALGVAVGGLVRHPVPAVTAGVVWVLLVENLGAGLLERHGRWLPGQAAQALMGTGGVGEQLAPGTAGAVLVLYVLIAALAAGLSFARRDV